MYSCSCNTWNRRICNDKVPPYSVYSKNGAAIFYSLVLPVSLYLGTVVSLLVIIYLEISKVHMLYNYLQLFFLQAHILDFELN